MERSDRLSLELIPHCCCCCWWWLITDNVKVDIDVDVLIPLVVVSNQIHQMVNNLMICLKNCFSLKNSFFLPPSWMSLWICVDINRWFTFKFRWWTTRWILIKTNQLNWIELKNSKGRNSQRKKWWYKYIYIYVHNVIDKIDWIDVTVTKLYSSRRQHHHNIQMKVKF